MKNLLLLLFAALLGLSFCGAWLPLGDSLAVGRLHLAAALAMTALYLLKQGAVKASLIILLLVTLVSGPILAALLSPGTPANGHYRLYQKNLHGKAWPRYSLADDILASGADFVTLQEVSEHNLYFMNKLFRAYNSKTICGFDQERGVAVMSRFPMVAGSGYCDGDDRLAFMQVRLPSGEAVWLVALHLHWPFPFEQAEQAERIADRLRLLKGPIVLGGDFNMVPWGGSVALIARAARVNRLGPYRPSFPKFGPLLPLPIDHVMLPYGATGSTEVRPLLGSDHLGILAGFNLYIED